MQADSRGLLGRNAGRCWPSPQGPVKRDVLNRMLIQPRRAGGALIENDEKEFRRRNGHGRGRFLGADEDEDREAGRGVGGKCSCNAVGFVNGSAALSSFLPGGNAADTQYYQSRRGYARNRARARDGLVESSIGPVDGREAMPAPQTRPSALSHGFGRAPTRLVILVVWRHCAGQE